MPTYEYKCLSCEHQFERFQRMTDDPVMECEVCGEPVKRLLFPVAVHFKGNGFYSTDYAKKNTIGTPGASAGSGGASESSASSDDKGSAPVSAPSETKVSEPAAAAPSKD